MKKTWKCDIKYYSTKNNATNRKTKKMCFTIQNRCSIRWRIFWTIWMNWTWICEIQKNFVQFIDENEHNNERRSNNSSLSLKMKQYSQIIKFHYLSQISINQKQFHFCFFSSNFWNKCKSKWRRREIMYENRKKNWLINMMKKRLFSSLKFFFSSMMIIDTKFVFFSTNVMNFDVTYTFFWSKFNKFMILIYDLLYFIFCEIIQKKRFNIVMTIVEKQKKMLKTYDEYSNFIKTIQKHKRLKIWKNTFLNFKSFCDWFA